MSEWEFINADEVGGSRLHNKVPIISRENREEPLTVNTFWSAPHVFHPSHAYRITDYARATDNLKNAEYPAPCHGCVNYFGETHNGNRLICGIHPYGAESDNCPDWEGDTPDQPKISNT